MTEFLDIYGGRIAYEEAGQRPLIVLSHGVGDHRRVYRFRFEGDSHEHDDQYDN